MKPRFSIEFLPDAVAFMKTIDDKAREKILFNMRKSQHVNDPEILKKLNDHIWEFRTLYRGIAYRLFAFWDKTDTLVLATHGLIKKTQKTPQKELEKATQIRAEYFEASR